MENSDVKQDLPIDDITGVIINESMKIHKRFGPGMLESVCELILAQSLVDNGLQVSRQHSVSFQYRGAVFTDACRIDLLVEDRVIVEIKSVQHTSLVHAKQVLTYLRLTDLQVGLLINFGKATLKEGVERVVNNYFNTTGARLRVNKSRQ